MHVLTKFLSKQKLWAKVKTMANPDDIPHFSRSFFLFSMYLPNMSSIYQETVAYRVVSMSGEGSCIFQSLSYMYKNYLYFDITK